MTIVFFSFPDVTCECLHHEFVTDAIIARMHEQLEVEYRLEFQQLCNEIKQKTKLKLFQNIGDARAIEDKYSLDYEPQSIFELDAFHLLLMERARL
jgi:hypothetical protein